MNRCIKINNSDNVAVAIKALSKGEKLQIGEAEITVGDDIPPGHKIALIRFASGDHIIKYGFPIGHAREPISQGGWVNETNIKTNLEGFLNYSYQPSLAPLHSEQTALTFKGYRRENGEVGIRNELWIIPTVGCVNGICRQLAEELRIETKGKEGVDAIVAFPHNYGCSQLGDDHENTRKILRNMVQHPNAGGVLIVGLGCENNQPEAFRKFLGDYNPQRVRFMVAQEVDDEIETGMQLLRELYAVASKDKRTDIPLSELRVGLKCGGSDGFSGITANPLLGVFSDFLVVQGGTTVLTEVPEMFGAETLLMNRSASEEVFDKTVQLINSFKAYFIANNQPVYENPSPGNKAGGISTLEEKSLGCTQKSGASAIQDVLLYGDRLQIKGLNLLSAPGNDLVAATALAASGCQLILFTTGRGTPFGTFVPTLKIATNTDLYNRKPGWIDFNAGTLLEGEDMESVCRCFARFVLHMANGTLTHQEKNDYREIAIFKTGVTL
ncbi:Altronate dehydratase [termite gut metagenome]|uniref:Altronate dehydratase n=1 Tax=termite gut metagenome TaxID=433724 RepID=A0A5J4S400_9ZZZZ